MNAERWLPIPGWPQYEVSDHGHVRNARTGRIRSQSLGSHGYPQITLTSPGRKPVLRTIHGLVAVAFIGARPGPDYEVAHLNACRTDARLTNLAWVTRSANNRQAYAHGRTPAGATQRGEAHPRAKLTRRQVLDIRARAAHTSLQALAAEYGLTRPGIANIVNRKSWRWLPGPEVASRAH